MLGKSNRDEGDGGPVQKIRFEPTTLSRVWASVRKHLTPLTHPSTTSESAMGSGLYAETDLFGYDEGGGRRTRSQSHLPLELIDPVAARHRKKGMSGLLKGGSGKGKGQGGRTDSSKRGLNSLQQSGSRYDGEDDEGPWEPVSTVVVDNDFEQVVPLAARSDSGSTRTPGASASHMGATTKEGSSLFGPKSEDVDEAGQRRNSVASEVEGLATTGGRRDEDGRNWIQQTRVYEMLMVTMWPSVKYFFDSKYIDPQKEYAFMREVSAAWMVLSEEPG